jgi:uncharacterized membrane protein
LEQYAAKLRRGPGILIGGGILVIAGIIIVILSIYSLTSLSISMPTDVSTKSLIKSALNLNQTAVKETIRNIGISLGLAFTGMLVATILIVNGIIALIGGTVIFFIDRRHDKLNPPPQHSGSPVGH